MNKNETTTADFRKSNSLKQINILYLSLFELLIYVIFRDTEFPRGIAVKLLAVRVSKCVSYLGAFYEITMQILAL